MNLLPDLIDSLGLTDPSVYLIIFFVASLVMVWRLEAMLDHGLEGTALGTLIMPYCSGLGNIVFVGIVLSNRTPTREVAVNCLVNNVTNLTLLLGLPAVLWGLSVLNGGKGAAATEQQINRLSLLLTLTAVLFFSGALWIMGQDGRLDARDGALLVGAFLFWQSFQIYDVLKHNLRRKKSFGLMFYLDAALVLVCAYGIYGSIDWLVPWLTKQQGALLNAGNLGWLSGWLMVVPNAVLALYWGWRRRADVVFSSQIGDGHICIPFCLGLCALFAPVELPDFFNGGLLILLGAALFHVAGLLGLGGLPRWAGAVLIAAYAVFLWLGLIN